MSLRLGPANEVGAWASGVVERCDWRRPTPDWRSMGRLNRGRFLCLPARRIL
jgi:hypothetical protein